MPQISVNEIDQSVVTRVVSDDKVKVLVPIISSFGPGYDGTLKSINTFTDITDFNRVYGYTDAQFNPFKEDNSRTYAAQLIQRGGAVSVVRVNNSGETSSFDLGAAASDRSTPGWNTLSPAVTSSWTRLSSTTVTESSTLVINGSVGVLLAAGTLEITGDNGSIYTETNCVVSSNNITTSIIDSTGTVVGTATYTQPTSDSTSGKITISTTNASLKAGLSCSIAVTPYTTDSDFFKKNTFCPQIESIVAKYPGSFGDNLIISISQVNTTRVSESYQYASISVYYANKISVYATDENGGTLDNSYITGVTLLENKRVSTNPSDAMYFEDVEFDFIKIIGTANARDELALIWSNIGSGSSSSAKYSGFPVVKLKYINDSGVNVFNTEALLSGGTDFAYSDDVLQKLKLGFLGYYGGSGSWTKDDVDSYLTDVYGSNNDGIIPNIYKSITNLYADFTDPYVYDFDFITAGGFVYEEYDLTYTTTTTTVNTTVTSSETPVDLKTLTGTTATPALKGSTTVTVVVGTGSTAATYKAVSTQDDETVVNLVDPTSPGSSKGSVDFVSGKVTIDGVTGSTQAAITFTYNDSNKPKHAEVILPESNSDNYVTYSDVNPIHAAMINLANTRQDCIALCDLPAAYDPNYAVEYARMLNTSYATIHHPWCYVQSPYNANKLLHMAPSYIFMYTFLSNLIDNVSSQKWFPPAGVTRATARVVKKPDYEIGSVILNNWQNDNTSRVNPIMKLKQYGYVIYGQYTALPAIDMNTHSALESLNVRLISNVVKKKIFDVCLNMAFEPNTATLWLKFFSQMDEFLRYMQYNNGVYDYKIVMDESTVTTDDINHLRCPGKVYIAPTRTAEFFDIDFIITEAGATFTED